MSGALFWVSFPLLFDFSGSEFQGAVLLLGDDEDLANEGVVGVVEDAGGIEWAALYARLEMQMYACRSACLTFQSHRVACLQPLPYLDKIAGMVAVERLQAVGMTQNDAVSVGIIGSGKDDFARESSPRSIVAEGLQVGASMMTSPSERTVHFGSGKGIAPLLDGIVGEVDGKLVAILKRVFRCLHLHDLPLININRVFLSENRPPDPL